MSADQRYAFYSDADMSEARHLDIPWERERELRLYPAAFRTGWTDFDDMRGRIYRDDLRNGWHVVPEGVRYVAVKGVKAGQRVAPFGSGAKTACHEAVEFGDDHCARLWKETADHDDSDRWAVLDLHDLGDKRPTVTVKLEESVTVYKRTEPSPRFQVKPAASMREGEPIVWSLTLDRGEGGNDRTAAEVIRDKQRALEAANYGQEWKADIPEHAASHARFIIDTHSPDWQAFDAKHRREAAWDHMAEACTPAPPLVLPEIAKPQRHRWQKNEQRNCMECQCGAWAYTALSAFPDVACELAWKLYEERAKPQGPTDAEIVAQYERIMHGDEVANGANDDWRRGLSWASGGRIMSATWAQYQAARSRELQKRAAESREKDRQRVVCEGTLAEDY